jgi:hypothetical protein
LCRNEQGLELTRATKNKPSRKPANSPPVVAKPAATSQAYCPPPDELDKRIPNLKHVGGSKSDIWNQYLANQAMRADWYGNDPKHGKDLDDQKTAVLAFLVGVKPTDVIEGMMAAQLFASHAAAMDCYRRAMLPNQSTEGRESNLALAAKLTRANASQVEALTKHRGKGQQKVIVEHVHVYQGGQAIVGNVVPRGAGGNYEGQPHAITHAASAPMRCQDTQRQALPIAGDAERTLPDARRPIAGRA